MFERGLDGQGGDIRLGQISRGRLCLDALGRELLHPLGEADGVAIGRDQPRARFSKGLLLPNGRSGRSDQPR